MSELMKLMNPTAKVSNEEKLDYTILSELLGYFV
jgi:hypothetical protein